MAKPALDQVQRDTGLHRGHAKPMPQSLGAGLHATDVGSLHHLLDLAPRRGFAPRPQLHRLPTVFPLLGFAEVMGEVQHFDEVRRDWNRTEDTSLTFLHGLKGNGVGLEVDAIRAQCSCFGGTASGVREDVAKRLHLTRKLLSRGKEPRTFFPSEVFALTIGMKKFSRHLLHILPLENPYRRHRLS